MKESRRSWRARLIWAILAGGFLAFSLMPVEGQYTFNEREVKSQPSALDKTDTWALDFRFKDPRQIKVYVPYRGTRIYWYLWYQVVNRTGEPREFYPEFELVTRDYPASYYDLVSPGVQDAVKRIEDPTGYQDIKNSVIISSKPIPLSLKDAFPRAITGVAIWEASGPLSSKREPGEKELREATHFSIFVRGLSNGSVRVDPKFPDDPPITRFKTLQLNFKREGDRDAVFLPPADWIYRAGRTTTVLKDAEDKAGK